MREQEQGRLGKRAEERGSTASSAENKEESAGEEGKEWTGVCGGE